MERRSHCLAAVLVSARMRRADRTREISPVWRLHGNPDGMPAVALTPTSGHGAPHGLRAFRQRLVEHWLAEARFSSLHANQPTRSRRRLVDFRQEGRGARNWEEANEECFEALWQRCRSVAADA